MRGEIIMNIKYFDSKALREVYIILERLNMLDEIPKEFVDYMKKEQDLSHDFTFNENVPLINQLENENTKMLITYLVDKYIKNKAF